MRERVLMQPSHIGDAAGRILFCALQLFQWIGVAHSVRESSS